MIECITTISQMRQRAEGLKQSGKRIGLVPTMGALHEGHLSLMRQLRPHCDSLWVSIFVNPAQFGPAEDLSRYPRTLERDLELCASVGVDGVLHPEPAEVYPQSFGTWVVPDEVGERFCGASRPGHFRGVLSIVLRLFMWTSCDCAIFGRKDAQQLWLIERMVRDLALPVVIHEGELVREADGLAMSSRNAYLTTEERVRALLLHQALKLASELVESGQDLGTALCEAGGLLQKAEGVELEYFHAVDWRDFSSVGEVSAAGFTIHSLSCELDRLLFLVAARVGKTRLIDNLSVNCKQGD